MLTHQQSAPPVAAGTAHHFTTLDTDASPEALFQAWIDVARWPTWDTALESASLDGPFRLGAEGELKSRGSPPSTFTIVRFSPLSPHAIDGAGYAFASALPLGRLVVDRQMKREGARLRFTHDVRFEGVGGWLLGFLLGPGFRRALPEVMQRLELAARGVS